MLRLLFLIAFFPLFALGQIALKPEEQTKAYSAAISEYIKIIEVKNKSFKFDTLFIGKHEEFPEIKLPVVIQNKTIILLEHKKGDKEPHNRRSFVLINIIEEKLAKDNTEFLVITFHKEYNPQHNCHIKLKYNSEKKEFEEAEKVKFEYPYTGTKN